MIALVSLAVVLGLIVAAGVWVVNFFAPPAPPLAVGCTAVVGDKQYTLAPDQAENAALIAAVSVNRGLPSRAASIALAVALQESKLRNISYGDLDSEGLFQQRPSQGWGTRAQILDPVHASNAFYDVLEGIAGYQVMPVTEAAQLVQRSAYPEAYAQREPLGKAFASALTGLSPAALSCTLDGPTAAGSPAAVVAKLQRAYGALETSTAAGIVAIPAGDVAGWSYAQWAVANASSLNITEVAFAGRQWVRADNVSTANKGWQPSAVPAGNVVITVRAAPPT
ncbi:hypothetical protein IV498_12590 [Paenarthrobacter sp. Z7-10]|uniref:hypothetical protein n=1 Tax=Paenarthrobacter sp. Z7-10 TaxID=2787635 RepID=UPI003FA77666|nr:hypothetical protein [Paenarthrobacter sp. Z7-10]